MFGGKKHVESTARVVSVTPLTTGPLGEVTYSLTMDVSDPDASPFPATAEARFGPGREPKAGDLILVRYDPKTHQTEVLGSHFPAAATGFPGLDLSNMPEGEHESTVPAASLPGMQGAQGEVHVYTSKHTFGNTFTMGTEVGDLAGLAGLANTILSALNQHGVVSGQAVDATAVPGLPQAITAALQAHGVTVPPPQPASAPADLTSDPSGRVHHLKSLVDSGLLTPEEFQLLQQHHQGTG